IAKEAGFRVTGSDIEEEFITSECLLRAGIVPIVGFSKENVDDADLLITTGAHGGFDNAETLEAKKRGIKVITKGEAVGLFMDGKIFGKHFEGISVAGSHGKTTLTAILATVLRENSLDPTFIVGTGNIPSLGNPGHFGKGKYFVAEADEYATEPKYDKKAQFLWQYPKIEVFTNIELDHPDIYKNVDEVRKVFLDFANQLPEDGILVCCGDDDQIRELLKEFRGKFVTYGLSGGCDFILENVRVSENQTFFWIKSKGVSLGEFSIKIAGEHNALNALGALVVALELGLSPEAVEKSLKAFSGTKRRFEYKGTLRSGALVYDDYAHHPTEIRETLKAFRQSFPKYKLICVFQPHTYSRTKKLFEQFSRSFTDADGVILTDIYSSLREDEDKNVSSELLSQDIAKFNKNVIFLSKLSDVVEYVDKNNFEKNTVLITMGAGDVYKAGERLLWKG
ncbi:MAG: UDP-N-acetylmuramate--L-alanine ligase, partial [Patescibacteria group bacterium]